MIDQGTYRARAVNAELGLTKNGHEQIGIEFELLDLPGQRIAYYGTFTDGGTPHTIKAMRAAGFRGNDILDLSSLSANDTPEVSLVVEHEEWDGRWRAKVKWVNSLGGVSMKSTLDPQRARQFAALMKQKLAAVDGGAPQQAPQRPAPAAQSRSMQQPSGRGRGDAQTGAPMAGDEIPFRARFDGPRDTDRPSVRARWSKAMQR